MNRIERIKELLAESTKDNFLRHALALEYIKVGEDKIAKDLFLDILTESPNYIGSYYHLAKLLEKLGETPEAIIWYERGMVAAKEGSDQHAFNELRAAYEDLVF